MSHYASTRVLLAILEARRSSGIYALAVVAVCHNECVDKGGENEQEAENIGDKPEVVEHAAEFSSVMSVAEDQSDDSSTANKNECCSSCSVAGMTLVGDEVCWFALEIVFCAFVFKSESFAGVAVEPTNHARNEGELNDGDHHEKPKGDVQQRTRRQHNDCSCGCIFQNV
ncbi:hypothetical protein HG530_000369 [Fusarium avenaceum]|nr:hypothetical protein HG530_000369 [Fusarium avenaceum]